MNTSSYKDLAFAIICTSILFVLLVLIVVLVFIIAQKRRNKHILETVELKNQFSQTILQTQIEIQEETLKTISQEIHDNIGQVLSLTKLTISSIDSNESNVIDKLNTTKTLLNKVILDIRDLSKSLNTDTIEAMGLDKAIENEVELINKSAISANFSLAGAIVKQNPKTELILFRVVQECLNNAMKHAQAKNIDVTLQYTSSHLIMNVVDDGIGFDANETNTKGMGLKNMQNRISLIGGTMQIESNNNGTKITMTLNV